MINFFYAISDPATESPSLIVRGFIVLFTWHFLFSFGSFRFHGTVSKWQRSKFELGISKSSGTSAVYKLQFSKCRVAVGENNENNFGGATLKW